MSNQYFYGKAVARAFYAIENNDPIQLPPQTPTIYVFDLEPTRTAAASGTNALAAAVVTWTEAATTPWGRTYTLAAINDPEPTGGTYTKTYYEAINYITKAAGQVQTTTRTFELTRARSVPSVPGTSVADLTMIYTDIDQYKSNAQLLSFLTLGEQELKTDLLAKGFEWADITNLELARWCVAYRALADACFSLIGEEGDRHERRFNEYKAQYEKLRDAIPFMADANRDGKEDGPAQIQGNAMVASR